MSLPGQIQASNTILYCRHWAETVCFYQQQLCLPINYQNDWFVEFRLTPSSFVSIANATRASITAVDGQGITLTLQVNDVPAVHHFLQAQGVAVGPIQHKWQANLFYCHDPEGHRLEVWAAAMPR